ncbi:copper amine oxidase N-terminal domain-containing protein [Paenibacillus oleatilyticus]|uniref:Copper amine oxidase N-terminal domain-containing protein n=1 Tax=Paenibacillus oleatilyticus TaxID=2594886 RepID=A0ABV4VCA3_9BACL
MNKKIAFLFAGFMFFAGVVSASSISSINGDYKGNPIVKVFLNGNQINSEVPAMIIDGTTMIPLRSVSESLGTFVLWDDKTYTVNLISPTANQQQQPAQTGQAKIKGPLTIYSNDGKTYLGKLTANDLDTDSIYNDLGTYGSKFSTTSIWNEFGTYGGKFSLQSAFNDFATEPPIILDGDGNITGYLTTNKNIQGAVSPIGLKVFLKDQGY